MNNLTTTGKSTNLTTTDQDADWVLLQKQCKAWLASQFLPPSINDVAKAVTIVMIGRELDLPPLTSLREINIVQGKPCFSAQLMMALVYKKIPGAQLTFITPPERQHTESTIEACRPGGKPQQFSFTVDMAKSANLLGKSNWKQHLEAMLRARAVAAAVRAVFPDALAGCYLPDELGGDISDSVQPPNPTPRVTKENTVAGQIDSNKAVLNPEQRNQSTVGTVGEWDKARPGWQNDLATPAQIKRLHAIAKGLNLSHEDLRAMVKHDYNLDSTSDLTKGMIQSLFNTLEEEQDHGLPPSDRTTGTPAHS